MDKKSNQTEKARLGAIGENNVVSMLMQKGWDAFNANCTIKNFKAIDIVCLNSDLCENEDKRWKPKTALVQVKTSVASNIPVGFNIGECLSVPYLEQMVKGPYVFVSVKDVGNGYAFRYFVLSRRQFIRLANAAHEYYVNGYKRDKELNLESPAGLYVRWLEGKDDEATERHIAFRNPLVGRSCEDCWENIWAE